MESLAGQKGHLGTSAAPIWWRASSVKKVPPNETRITAWSFLGSFLHSLLVRAGSTLSAPSKPLRHATLCELAARRISISWGEARNEPIASRNTPSCTSKAMETWWHLFRSTAAGPACGWLGKAGVSAAFELVPVPVKPEFLETGQEGSKAWVGARMPNARQMEQRAGARLSGPERRPCTCLSASDTIEAAYN